MTEAVPKILVVDDEAPLRELVAVTLGDDFACDEAEDGNAALARLARHRYDVVMLDIMMPGLGGLDVLRAIRADDQLRDVPVAVMSAWQSPEDIAAAREAGADEFIAKPFHIDELASVVKGLVEGRS